MRPKQYPYSQKRPFPSKKRVRNYMLAIEELNSLLPHASKKTREKIEKSKQFHFSFLKSWDLDLLPEQEFQSRVD